MEIYPFLYSCTKRFYTRGYVVSLCLIVIFILFCTLDIRTVITDLNYKRLLYTFSVLLFVYILADLFISTLLRYLRKMKNINLKIWEYNSYTVLLLSICFVTACVTKVNIGKCSKCTSDENLTVVINAVITAIISLFLNQFYGYTDADINACQHHERSIGAYWAEQAYDSYYCIVLEGIIDRMSSFEEKHDVKLLVKKLIIVAPDSCNVNNTFMDESKIIVHFNYLSDIKCDQGANINREYKNPVYKISSDNFPDVYIATECPNSMLLLWELKHVMDNHIFEYHRNCFIKTLKSLVKGRPCIIAEYKDEVENPEMLSEFLISALSEKENTIINIEF